MNKKNIWIINQYTGSPYHGMNYRSYYLAKEFIKKGHTVTIFAGSYSHLFSKFPRTNSFYTNENIDGVNYIWVKTPKYKNSRSIGRVINMLVFMFMLFFVNVFKLKKPDEIIISSLSLFPVLNAFLWSKIFNIKFIFEVRDIWPLTLVELGNFSLKHPLVLLLSLFERLGYTKSKYVVSVLPKANLHMSTKGMEEDKFRYIPNGIQFSEKQLAIDEEIKSKLPNDKFIIGYAGTIGIANALDTLIDAAILLKDNKNIHFVLVGAGGEKESLMKKCKNNNLYNVTFINAIPKNKVQSMLQLFDVCYIGWHKQNLYKFGISANKIFDYMYSKKPIIHATNAANDPISDSDCGWTIGADNAIELKSKILEVYTTDREKLLNKGNNGYEYVIEKHNYSVLAEKFEVLFS